MIVTIAEHFTRDPSDRERSPTIIWKPGFIMHVRTDSNYKFPRTDQPSVNHKQINKRWQK